jgi:hypothetical protein
MRIRIYVDMPAQTLTVTMAGSGQATVTSEPAGISCAGPTTPGGTCQAPFPYAQTVTLTATPETGTTFLGWTPGVGTTCTGTAASRQQDEQRGRENAHKPNRQPGVRDMVSRPRPRVSVAGAGCPCSFQRHTC